MNKYLRVVNKYKKEVKIMNKVKYCVFFGDSITEGVGVNIGERYFDRISQKLGVKTAGYGVNGAQSVHVPEQIAKMQAEHKADEIGKIFVLIGTNDFANSVPIGEFFTESVEAIPTLYDENGNFARSELRKKRSFIFDKNTFCGRLNIIFEKLKKDYPFADIIIMTPLHRAYAYFGGDNIQPNELYANGAGRYFDEYVQTVRKCADVWSLKLIDLYRDSGLYPLDDGNAALYFCSDKTDRLHPNANGHARIAETIMQTVKLN